VQLPALGRGQHEGGCPCGLGKRQLMGAGGTERFGGGLHRIGHVRVERPPEPPAQPRGRRRRHRAETRQDGLGRPRRLHRIGGVAALERIVETCEVGHAAGEAADMV
jgi:hypothetical protein